MTGRRAVRLLVIVASLAAVALVTIWESRERLSPGPLHPSHASVSELSGNAGCAACHGRWGRSMATACGACHTEVAAQLEGGFGLHGGIEAADDCARCHAEHNEGAIALVSDLTFARSGVDDPARYDHHHLAGFPLEGAHDALACTACHPQADAPALAAGERRYLGLDVRCTACHDDPHADAYGPDCASCHGQVHAFEAVAAFAHDPAFPLDGAHQQACAACHEAGTATAVDALRAASGAGSGPDVQHRSCIACHDSPHTPALARAFADPNDCATCHDAARSSFAGGAAQMSRDAHASIGFPLVTPHADLECAACHGTAAGAAEQPAPRPFAERFPGRAADACRACHDDPHAGQFDSGPAAGRCQACHAGAHFVPSTFDLLRHDDTAFPLADAHAALECSACHEADAAGVQRFASTPTACAACHDDPHAGQFGDDPVRAACTACHDTVHFVPSRFDLARHEITAFPLVDAHADVACAECHVADAAGVRRFAGLPTDCASCHDDPHAAQFDAGLTGGRCLECHDTVHFVPSSFDAVRHAATAFPLEDAHAEVGCQECHLPDDGGVRRFAGVATACASCHDDPHRGQFDDGQPIGDPRGRERDRCLDCHGTAHFMPSAFDLDDHARTGFPLEGGHAAVGCDRCHPRITGPGTEARAGEARPGAIRPGPAERPTTFTRFVPTERACAACHEDAHRGLFDGADRPAVIDGRTGCARCHAADAPSFAGVRFARGEHERWTDYALEGAHADLDCRACHRPGVDPDPRRRAFGRAERACASCHDDPHDAQFAVGGLTDCARCHVPATFDIPRFEHDRTRFPLDETHAPLACSACHRAAPDGVVRYRPLGTRCQDCHGFAPGDRP